MIFNTLKQLDDFDINKAVANGWAKKKTHLKTYSKGNMAIIAAKFGHKDALEYLIYAYGKEKNQYLAARIRDAIYKLTGETLSPRKMKKWYKENEAKLVFGQKNEKYVKKVKIETK